jgi:hypothetical protein
MSILQGEQVRLRERSRQLFNQKNGHHFPLGFLMMKTMKPL